MTINSVILWRPAFAVLVCGLIGAVAPVAGSAQTTQEEEEEEIRELAPLGGVPVPKPRNLASFVRDEAAAIRLGKALFWDTQVGSDGKTACATCHFAAGADPRVKNQLGPGELAGDSTYQIGGPNHTLEAGDFPFTRHEKEDDPDSPIVFDANDIAGSQGVFNTSFDRIYPNTPGDGCLGVADAIFNGATRDGRRVNTRRVEPRNTPSVINAIFNFRNFWDGRATHDFNGLSVFGARDLEAAVYKVVDGRLNEVEITIEEASLASQAVGPPLSAFEMSCANRSWAIIGRKLLRSGLTPLGQQKVHAQDSRLGPISYSDLRPPGSASAKGLWKSYEQMVREAFQPEYWSSSEPVLVPADDDRQGDFQGNDVIATRDPFADRMGRLLVFSQMEANMALFFGLAVQLYESTLVSDESPLDRFLEGDRTALTTQQKRGKKLFETVDEGGGRCIACHNGAELTAAAIASVEEERLERMVLADGACAVYDQGFFNIGVRPTADDPGVGGTDPFGHPLSETRMAMAGLIDIELEEPLGSDPECDGRANVDGAFKAPGLRNVELTGPYFHNGGKATLKQVAEFYDRGGDFGAVNVHDRDADIRPLGLTEDDEEDLVAFLLSFTDARVRFKRAPFDSPEICVPNGHKGLGGTVRDGGTGTAADDVVCIPETGAAGAAEPLKTFLDLSPFSDGEEDEEAEEPAR